MTPQQAASTPQTSTLIYGKWYLVRWEPYYDYFYYEEYNFNNFHAAFSGMDRRFAWNDYFQHIHTGISVGGLLANIIVMVIFLRVGLNDAVTIVLFNIAVSDFSHLFCRICAYSVTMLKADPVIMIKGSPIYISIHSFYPVFIILQHPMVVTNSFLTTFLAVQRCLCVVRPLQVKGMFNRLRAVVVMVVIWGYCIISYVPLFSQLFIRKTYYTSFNETSNGPLNHLGRTYYMLEDTFLFNQFHDYTDLVNGSILLLVCQVVVVTCVVIMLIALKKSMKFRKTTTHSTHPAMRKGIQDDFIDWENEDDDDDENKVDVRSSRERQVVIQVILVSVIFLFAHFHFTIYTILNLFINIRYSLKHATGHDIYKMFDDFFYVFNSSINIFVYLKYNSKFRRYFFRR